MSNDKNPFAVAKATSQSTSLASAREESVIQSMMVVAKRFPRDERAAMDAILNACTRPSLASAALYTYARGGQDISGPSVRLAEAMAQAWGNIDCGVQEVEQRDGVSVMEAYAIDLQSNYRMAKRFTVAHERHTRSGARKLTDPRDIYEVGANQGARRMRACILAVIPGDVTEAAVNQCDATMAADADTSPAALAKLVKAFGELGVDKAAIEARIQRRMEAIRPAQVISLRKIYLSIRDGMSNPSDWFAVGAAASPLAPAADLDRTPEPPASKAGMARAMLTMACESLDSAELLDAIASLSDESAVALADEDLGPEEIAGRLGVAL